MFPIKGSHSYFIVPKIYFGFSFIMTIYLLGMYWNHILLFDLLILRIALLYVYLWNVYIYIEYIYVCRKSRSLLLKHIFITIVNRTLLL